MSVFDILIELESTGSKLEKAKIFSKHKNNPVFERVCLMAYDPFTNYYIRKVPEYKTGKPTMDLEEALDALSDLSARIVTGHAGIAHLKNILESVSQEDAVVIERIIDRDLKIGASEGTINRCWKDLVTVYPVMLATAYEKKLVDKLEFPLIVQTKFDGMRFNAIVQNGAVEYRARSGKEVLLLGSLDKEFLALAKGMDAIVFDGELLVRRDGKTLSRQEGNGILNKAVKGTIGADEAAMVVCTLWDAIPFEGNFAVGESHLTYENRLKLLRTPINDRIMIAESHYVKSLEEVNKIFQKALTKGEEGILLKDPRAGWQDKRVKHQIKFKNELECDLECVAWQEGSGKYTNMLGALVLRSSDNKVNVAVGTGFSDAMRGSITSNSVIGKIVSVKYNSLITDVNGEMSLFLPVFVEVREDKKKADSLKEIK